MSTSYKNFISGIGLIPNASTQNTVLGDLEVLSGSNILNFHNGTTSSQVITASHSATLTNKTISGSSNTLTNIANASLVYSSLTINGNSVSLGGSTTITASTTSTLTIGTGLSGTSFNGSTPVTIAIDSTVVTLSGSQTLLNKTLTSPILTTPNIGTPSSGDLSNCTNLPLGSITGLATGIATFLATPTSANLAAAVTNETGTGALVFANTPTLVTPILGSATASSITGIAGGDLTIGSAASFNLVLNNAGSLQATVSSTGLDLATGKILKLNNTGTIGISAGASSASYNIVLPTASPTANTALVYDGTNFVWGSSGGWSSSIQGGLAAGGTVTISLTKGQQAIEVAGSGAAVTLSITPFGSSAPTDKTVVRLIGTSTANSVSLTNNDASYGCILNGNAKLGLGSVIELMYVSSIIRWVETFRNF